MSKELAKDSDLSLTAAKPFTAPDTPEGCERGQLFVGKVKKRHPYTRGSAGIEYETPSHAEILNGDWWLVEKWEAIDSIGLKYCTPTGYVSEFYHKDGILRAQTFVDKNFRPIQDLENWAGKSWHINGKIWSRQKNVIPDNGESLDYLQDYIEATGGKLTVYEVFDEQERLTWVRYFRVKDGEIFDVRESHHLRVPYWQTKNMISYSFDGIECAPQNEPCYLSYNQSALQQARYKVKRGSNSVYHRTDGPAIIDKNAPKCRQERYFLEGVEYAKAAWEKKVGQLQSGRA
ncbi:MAG: hypothetical protein E7K48_00685 [Varibaculum cambriense]|nr:hypothetical protein [Varibaculum cambriense]